MPSLFSPEVAPYLAAAREAFDVEVKIKVRRASSIVP
jgi:hypothetical protein